MLDIYFFLQLQVPERVHTEGKNSLAVHTLKDHLCQCPSKLSEELVRCMAAIYFWVCNAAPEKPENGCVPLESRSSTKVALPRQSVGGDQDCSWRSMMEISRILTDRNQHSRASYATSSYRWEVDVWFCSESLCDERDRSVFVVWSAVLRCNQLNDILVSKSWHLAGPSLDGPGSSILSIRWF